MKIDFNKIDLILAEKSNEEHKKGILNIFNENIHYFLLTSESISYENHSKWWDNNFDKEYIYIILYEYRICGYIRLTKVRTLSKDKNEISIALLRKFQNYGIGSYSLILFEKLIKNLKIEKIIANTEVANEVGQKFFENNGFQKTLIKYIKKL